MSNVATDNLPTVEEVKAKDREGVKDFLNARKAELDLKGEDINKIYNQRIDGVTFLELTQGDLTGIEILLEPAKKIVKLIKEIQGGKQTSHAFIFINNTEYLLILVFFFPASYHQTRPKNTFALS